MFDMGFEPQIMRIIQNVRPDRQTVMFSATFPRSVEALARKILADPVEIQVRVWGGPGPVLRCSHTRPRQILSRSQVRVGVWGWPPTLGFPTFDITQVTDT